MVEQTLKARKVAILVTHGFEQSEMTEPRQALADAGAETTLISPAQGKVKGWKHTQWGDVFPVDVRLEQAKAEQYDALLLPGGVMNPDQTAHQRQGRRLRQSFLRRRQAGRRDLPRPVDGDRGRRRERPDGHVLAIAQDGSHQRRRALGGSGGRHGPGPRH